MPADVDARMQELLDAHHPATSGSREFLGAQYDAGPAWVLQGRRPAHGGIGMTWEYPAHLYLKRAKGDRLIFGTAYRHRARLAELVNLPPN